MRGKHSAKRRSALSALTEPNRPLTTLAMVLACLVVALIMFAALVIGAMWLSWKLPLLHPY
jgi:ABC-type Na+ efflux pump permease subunit